ncbi:MAG: hypothetical protein IJD11_01535 [Oscillospiraceae bacterium]|nr:hypothetical protein [Oscillospiraceae bacterium]
MKKTIAIGIILLLICLSGCSGGYRSLQKEYRLPEITSSDVDRQENLSFLPQVDNKTPYRQLLTKKVDIHAFTEKYCAEYGIVSGRICDIANDIGIECLRQLSEKQLYSIHPVKQGGLLYIFYSYIDSLGFLAKDSYYVQKRLSSGDFSAIRLDSEIGTLKQIDPTAQIWENLYTADPSRSTFFGCLTHHYLTDGILEVGLKPKDGVLKVFLCSFHPFSSDPAAYPQKIMDQDRI